ncbi:MAG TPA: hypothetical protein VIY27_10845 [Myxococcota bacterium]
MSVRVRHIQFRKTKAGALIHGTVPVTPDAFDLELHMHRAVYLTSALEAPKWGTVQSYDGAAMSGGLIHNIALMPKTMTQGSFFGLLRRIELTARDPRPFQIIWRNLAAEGCYVAQDGKLRRTDNGKLVSGRAIRALFTPPNGNVPKRGPHWETAKAWAIAFHELFTHRSTYLAQIDFAAEWMARGRGALEMSVYNDHGVGGDSPIGVRAAALPPDVDLAMAVYHSFSVNGPGPAGTALKRARDKSDFARRLIRNLGTSSYGVWKEKRYAHTRRAVRKAGLWDAKLVSALMPAKL